MNLNLNLRQLKAFLGVAETSNFTKTAQKLHLSQAALSASIRELEAQLCCRLFERTTRSVELTVAGRELLPVALEVVRNLETITLQLQRLGQHGITRLRLGFTPMLASNVVPDLLDAFQREFPSVKVDIVDAGPHDLQRFVESDELDAAFGAFAQKISGMNQLQITPATLILVYSDQFATSRKRVTWAQVFEHPLIALIDKSPVQQLVNAMARKTGVDIQSKMVVNHLETALGMVETGFGVGVFPSFARTACRRYKVQTAEIYPAVNINYFRIMKAGKDASAAVDGITSLLIPRLQRS